jgi:hypothetical protein
MILAKVCWSKASDRAPPGAGQRACRAELQSPLPSVLVPGDAPPGMFSAGKLKVLERFNTPMQTPPTLQISCVQMHWAKPIEFNLARTLHFIKAAAKDGSRVVLFPEANLTSYYFAVRHPRCGRRRDPLSTLVKFRRDRSSRLETHCGPRSPARGAEHSDLPLRRQHGRSIARRETALQWWGLHPGTKRAAAG